MIKSVVRAHNWTIDYVDELYVDDEDSDGLKYWYDDVLAVSKSLRKPKKGAPNG